MLRESFIEHCGLRDLEYYGAEAKQRGESPPLNDREIATLTMASVVHVPLLRSLRQVYGPDRGWRLCGPDSMLRARFMSAASGIPFRADNPLAEEDTLEIKMGFTLSGLEHDFVCLNRNWCNEIVVIDGTANLQFYWDTDPERSLLIQAHNRTEFLPSLAVLFGLYPYEQLFRGTGDNTGVDIWTEGYMTDRTKYLDHLSLLHDDQVFQPEIRGPSGIKYDTSKWWGSHLIRALELTYEALPEGALESLERVWNPPRQSEQMAGFTKTSELSRLAVSSL